MSSNAVVVMIMMAVIVAAVIYYKTYNSRTHTIYDKNTLKENAVIIDIDTKVVGLKGERKYRTTVTFSDGFEYVSHDTERDDGFLTYTISLSERMKKQIVAEAIKAHCEAVGMKTADAFKTQEKRLGTTLRNDSYVCGICGHKGPYEGKCPQCSSSRRKYL